MKLIAMIPARLGSKRIPKKNLRYLGGKPLIQHAIDLSLGCSELSEVWVNTESPLIAQFAESAGAKVHRRPEELSSDKATNQQFTAEFLSRHECAYVIMVNPTSPLLRPETLASFCAFVKEGRFDTCLSVIEERAESLMDGKPLNFVLDRKINSQELTPIAKVVWALTAWRRPTFLDAHEGGQCGVYAGRLGTFAIPKDEACDLDTPEDWAIAEGCFAARSMRSEARYWET